MRISVSLLCLSLMCACTKENTSKEQAIVLPEPSQGQDERGVHLGAAKRAFSKEALRRRLRFWSEIDPSYLSNLTKLATKEDLVRSGAVSTETLIEAGRLLFEHEFTPSEGMQTPIRRINGPDSNTCTSCHWKSGSAGSGGLADNSLVFGTGDSVRSADSLNAPSLIGVGVAQMLAREMTLDLHEQRDTLVDQAQRTRKSQMTELMSKGVRFGFLKADETGELDVSQVSGIDPDLVVKPFRWKGTTKNLRSFVKESFLEHMGMTELTLSEGQVLAVVMFLAHRSPPTFGPSISLANLEKEFKGNAPEAQKIYEEEWFNGQQIFQNIGCAGCHIPKIYLESPVFETSIGVPPTPVRVDLSKLWNLQYDEDKNAYEVWFFSDLKRHDLGDKNANQHYMAGVEPRVFMTRRLWDLADTAPYMHDGRASWLNHAIEAHGGEAEAVRESYLRLLPSEQGDLRVFLMSLRRSPSPLVR